MKLKDLPSPGSRVMITFKEGISLETPEGIIYSAYKMPPGIYGVKDRWRVPFLPDGLDESEMKSFSIRSIESCEVIV